MSIYFSLQDKEYNYWVQSNSYYSMQNIDKFIKYFFPDNLKIEFNNTNNTNTNAVIYGIGLDDISKIDNKKLNILLCIENCNCNAYTWYTHYNKFGNFGNDKIQIYFYNHIDKCIFTDKYIAIPVIYTQISYLLKYYNTIEPSLYTNFDDKKICLIATNPSGFNKEIKNKIINELKILGECDTLDMYKNEIFNKSCYHSIELLNVFNKYKFVFVCENSLGSGYMTEKIFNCLFARCIPIYYGCKETETFIDKDCFININLMRNEDNYFNIITKINNLKDNEIEYNKIINANKIYRYYDDENYKNKLKEFIDNFITPLD